MVFYSEEYCGSERKAAKVEDPTTKGFQLKVLPPYFPGQWLSSDWTPPAMGMIHLFTPI
jgi:hypothetical protein